MYLKNKIQKLIENSDVDNLQSMKSVQFIQDRKEKLNNFIKIYCDSTESIMSSLQINTLEETFCLLEPSLYVILKFTQEIENFYNFATPLWQHEVLNTLDKTIYQFEFKNVENNNLKSSSLMVFTLKWFTLCLREKKDFKWWKKPNKEEENDNWKKANADSKQTKKAWKWWEEKNKKYKDYGVDNDNNENNNYRDNFSTRNDFNVENNNNDNDIEDKADVFDSIIEKEKNITNSDKNEKRSNTIFGSAYEEAFFGKNIHPNSDNKPERIRMFDPNLDDQSFSQSQINQFKYQLSSHLKPVQDSIERGVESSEKKFDNILDSLNYEIQKTKENYKIIRINVKNLEHETSKNSEKIVLSKDILEKAIKDLKNQVNWESKKNLDELNKVSKRISDEISDINPAIKIYYESEKLIKIENILNNSIAKELINMNEKININNNECQKYFVNQEYFHKNIENEVKVMREEIWSKLDEKLENCEAILSKLKDIRNI